MHQDAGKVVLVAIFLNAIPEPSIFIFIPRPFLKPSCNFIEPPLSTVLVTSSWKLFSYTMPVFDFAVGIHCKTVSEWMLQKIPIEGEPAN